MERGEEGFGYEVNLDGEGGELQVVFGLWLMLGSSISHCWCLLLRMGLWMTFTGLLGIG